MTQFPGAPSGASALEDPNSALGGGVPQTAQGQQFLLEEEAAYTARGGSFDTSGTLIPPDLAGDFWAFYQQAEAFAAATGWRHLPTPQVLIAGLRAGLGTAPSDYVNMWFANQMGVDFTKQPWIVASMSQSDWNKANDALNASVYELTGQSDWGSVFGGLSNVTAIEQGWSTQRITDMILKNGVGGGKYDYLKYGYNYNTFQNYKSQNKQALESRYGVGFTDAHAIQNLASPLPQFHASGGAFGQATPFVQTPSNLPTGYASSAR